MKDEDLLIESPPDPRFARGGQHVGLPRCIIRVTHKPTGLMVECGCERSQTKNRKVALSMLEWGLLEVGWQDDGPSTA